MLFLDVNKVWCVSSIECFHSRGQHLCKFIRTKKSVCIRKEFNSQRIGLKKPTWPPFHCFGTPIWPPWRHVKTPYRPFQHVLFVFCHLIILRELSHSNFHLIPVHMKRQRGKFPWDLTFTGKTVNQLEGRPKWWWWWWGGTPYNGLYEEAPPKRGTLFRLHVKSVRGSSLPLWNFLEYAPPAPRVPDSAEVLTPPWWFALCPEVFSRGIATGPAGCGSWSGW